MTVHSVDFVILTCTVFDTVAECNRRTDRQIDRQTDAQAIAKTREAFCCRAKKPLHINQPVGQRTYNCAPKASEKCYQHYRNTNIVIPNFLTSFYQA